MLQSNYRLEILRDFLGNDFGGGFCRERVEWTVFEHSVGTQATVKAFSIIIVGLLKHP